MFNQRGCLFYVIRDGIIYHAQSQHNIPKFLFVKSINLNANNTRTKLIKKMSDQFVQKSFPSNK